LISANLSEVRSWLEIVYGDMPGYLNICSTSNWQGRCFAATEIEEAVAYVDRLDKAGTQGIYARVTSLRELPDADLKSRGTEAQSSHLPGLWADLDICGPGHKTDKPLPATVEDAMRIIEVSGLPEPTIWIHSGGGLYPWWLLTQSAEITDLESMKILSSNWQTIIEHASKRLGYSYGTGVKDLARVLRIPGTVNRKIADDPRPCQIMHEESNGRQYTINELTDAMLACMPALPAPPPRRDLSSILASGTSSGEARPGDDFNARADWRDLLSDWDWVRQTSGTWYLRRPGKDEGISATLGHSTDGVERLYVFSDATVFEQNRPYDKYGAYVLLQHGGNFREATKTLSAAGYGTPLTSTQNVEYPKPVVQATPEIDQRPEAMLRDVDVDVSPEPEAVKPRPRIEKWTEVGAARFAAKIYGKEFIEVTEEYSERGSRGWRYYADGAWSEDLEKRVRKSMLHVSDLIEAQAESICDRAQQAYLESGTDENKKAAQNAGKLLTFSKGMASDRGIKAMTNLFSCGEGITRSIKAFDANPDLLCLNNGTFDLSTMKLRPHDRDDLLTRRMDVTFDADAKCPMWEQSMIDWIPNADMRAYVQRALGYTLLGKVEEGVFFVPWGETGCGKSQFIETIKKVFGDFGTTAEASTFRDKVYGSSDSTNNLHDLRGRRFVASSETTKGAGLNEELVKRATGEEALKTRALYQSNIEWTPEFVLWIATNFKPNLSADDGAIWRRVKPIEFPNNFSESQDRIKGLGKKMMAQEISGIFNWLLEGARVYLEIGLAEPAAMTQAVKDYRDEQDPVTQFLAEAEADGKIEFGEEVECESSKLFNVYVNHCLQNNLKPITPQRFGRILSDKKYGTRKGMNGIRWRAGIKIIWLADAGTPPSTDWPRRF
jgi:putative DNA primase/helicase